MIEIFGFGPIIAAIIVVYATYRWRKQDKKASEGPAWQTVANVN